MLLFFAQFDGGRRVERIRILEFTAGQPDGPAVFVDDPGGPDTLNGASIVGALGETRDGLSADERVASHWHYVVRLPHATLSRHGTPDVHFLRAEVEWSRPGLFGRQTLRSQRVLRVVVDPARFPTFGDGDRYFDTHAHTIAEQTSAFVLDVNGGSKAFAAPLVMLVESAYALGLVETPPRANDWSAYRDTLVVTHHNMLRSF